MNIRLITFAVIISCFANASAQFGGGGGASAKSKNSNPLLGGSSSNKQPAQQPPPPPPPSSNYYSYLRCWRCDYDDPEQCVKNFDYTKHKYEACDGKCLKAFEKVEARTKVEIDKAQMTPTIRKCVSQKEISSLQTLGINTKNGCHDIRTAKRRHKLYCFCENDLCNSSKRLDSGRSYMMLVFSALLLIFWRAIPLF